MHDDSQGTGLSLLGTLCEYLTNSSEELGFNLISKNSISGTPELGRATFPIWRLIRIAPYNIQYPQPQSKIPARAHIVMRPGIYSIYKGSTRLGFGEKPLRQDTSPSSSQEGSIRNVDSEILFRLFYLHQSMDPWFFPLHWHHRIPSHVSQETCSSLPSWSQRSTFDRKCTGYAWRELVVDLLAVGERL